MDRMIHYVMVTDRGEVHIQGTYRNSKSAENRMNNLEGGDSIDIWSTPERDPELAKLEFQRR